MSTDVDHHLRIEMFGALRACRQGRSTVRFRPQKPASLLAYLAFHLGPMHSRDELVELLWPEADPQAGRNRLKQTLSVVRSELEPVTDAVDRYLLADRGEIGLSPEWVVTDVAEFERRHKAATHSAPETGIELLSRAVSCYGGGLLPGLYDDWVIRERERLTVAHIEAIAALTSLLEQTGDLNQAIEFGRKVLLADPLREEAYSVLMGLYIKAGRHVEAARLYRDLETMLATALGEQPSLPVQALHRELHSGHNPGPRIDPGSLNPAAAPFETPDLALANDSLEPVGGAVSLTSPFYMVRPTDREFYAALRRNDSIVLVKGPHQVGKTSLLARGLAQARDAGARVVLTDLQRFTLEQLQSAEMLFRALADTIADQLELDIKVSDVWAHERGWNINFERFMRREVLLRAESQLVWGLDEVDRLFSYPYSSEVFALFRSWHNLRSLHPGGPWARLTQAIAYATEAHLFIADLNQSPFSVGTRLELDDFTIDQVTELNRLYGSPLADSRSVGGLHNWLGGHPYLIRRALYELSRRKMDFAAFKATTEREHGPFHDHLRNLIDPILADAALVNAVREALQTGKCKDSRGFYRLRSAGVLAGEPAAALLRCRLYADHLRRSLP